eukprot:CAMPEP_0115703520 /NCGR_PEP_ID=MMETSP0272-20121206/69146_1 /TAXON_ID=71861 /ORGANISM="Scrippsiella trochoidea, Strain CCMP3099" /LENGTH=708 /DNA_ID=CAMNT_0003144397 /DNA_START=855 /DNA_END=2983 /DNA_ORIENTATION=+
MSRPWQVEISDRTTILVKLSTNVITANRTLVEIAKAPAAAPPRWSVVRAAFGGEVDEAPAFASVNRSVVRAGIGEKVDEAPASVSADRSVLRVIIGEEVDETPPFASAEVEESEEEEEEAEDAPEEDILEAANNEEDIERKWRQEAEEEYPRAHEQQFASTAAAPDQDQDITASQAELESAALRIQAAHRGKQGRKEFEERRLQHQHRALGSQAFAFDEPPSESPPDSGFSPENGRPAAVATAVAGASPNCARPFSNEATARSQDEWSGGEDRFGAIAGARKFDQEPPAATQVGGEEEDGAKAVPDRTLSVEEAVALRSNEPPAAQRRSRSPGREPDKSALSISKAASPHRHPSAGDTAAQAAGASTFPSSAAAPMPPRGSQPPSALTPRAPPGAPAPRRPARRKREPPDEAFITSEEELRRRAQLQLEKTAERMAHNIPHITNYPRPYADLPKLKLEDLSSSAQATFVRVARFEAEAYLKHERQRCMWEAAQAVRQAARSEKLSEWYDRKARQEDEDRERESQRAKEQEEREKRKEEKRRKRNEVLQKQIADWYDEKGQRDREREQAAVEAAKAEEEQRRVAEQKYRARQKASLENWRQEKAERELREAQEAEERRLREREEEERRIRAEEERIARIKAAKAARRRGSRHGGVASATPRRTPRPAAAAAAHDSHRSSAAPSPQLLPDSDGGNAACVGDGGEERSYYY